MSEYSHTLIPESHDPVAPCQIVAFLGALDHNSIGPESATIHIAFPSGRVREFRHPITGEIQQLSIPSTESVMGRDTLLAKLSQLEHFNVVLAGTCPSHFLPWETTRIQNLPYGIVIMVRPFLFSTSCWHHDDRSLEAPLRPPFGQPCSSSIESGLFHHPRTMQVIEVPHGGCARFVIEFTLGKCMPPKIEGDLNCLQPKICNIAEETFGTSFVQGFDWCA